MVEADVLDRPETARMLRGRMAGPDEPKLARLDGSGSRGHRPRLRRVSIWPWNSQLTAGPRTSKPSLPG